MGRIDFYATESSRCKEQLDMVRDTDLKAQRDICNIRITRVTVIVAPSSAERPLSPSQGLSVIDSEQAGWSTNHTSCSYGRRSIPVIFCRPCISIIGLSAGSPWYLRCGRKNQR